MPRFVVATLAVAAVLSTATAQEPAAPPVPFCWHDMPTDVRAVAAANIITMSADPLGTGLASLAVAKPVDPAGLGAANPARCDLPQPTPGFTSGLGGGTVPQGFFPQASTAKAGSGAGGGGSGGGSGGGHMAMAQPATIEPGFWDVPVGPGEGVFPTGQDPESGGTGTGTGNGAGTVDTPEPGTLALGAIGMGCLAARRFRKRRAARG